MKSKNCICRAKKDALNREKGIKRLEKEYKSGKIIRDKINGIKISVDKVLDIAKTITTGKVKLQESKETLTKTMLITPKQQSIAKLFNRNFWGNR